LSHIKAKFMVGDSVYDIMAAKKAKVGAISVLTGLAKIKEILKYKPDFIANDVNELPRMLLR